MRKTSKPAYEETTGEGKKASQSASRTDNPSTIAMRSTPGRADPACPLSASPLGADRLEASRLGATLLGAG